MLNLKNIAETYELIRKVYGDVRMSCGGTWLEQFKNVRENLNDDQKPTTSFRSK